MKLYQQQIMSQEYYANSLLSDYGTKVAVQLNLESYL